MNTSLQGRVALVTGAARRVGREIVSQLAAQGMDIAFTYNNSEADADSLRKDVLAMGRQCLAVRSDLSASGAPEAIHDAVCTHFERLDVLVNNASTFDPSALGSVSGGQFTRDMTVNALAPLRLTELFAERLAAHFRPEAPETMGRIINFIDIHVLGEPLRGYVSYNASKAALMEITSTTALELAPAITVNAIAPGVVKWAPKDDPASQREYMRRVPLGRPGTPHDAATAVLFLVRDAHYSTGQIIRLDGGRYLT